LHKLPPARLEEENEEAQVSVGPWLDNDATPQRKTLLEKQHCMYRACLSHLNSAGLLMPALTDG
jgi:hypothetical protein